MKRIALAALLLAAAASAPGAAQNSIAVGQTVSGNLTRSDPRLDDGSHYRLYRVNLQAGQRVRVFLRSDDFDAYLAVGGVSVEDGSCIECVTNDDGAGGTDSRVTFAATRAGLHMIRVNTLTEGETGAYALSVEDAGPAPVVVPRGTLEAGTTVSGELDDGDPVADEDAYFEEWTFRPGRSATVVFELRSGDFDALLGVGTGSGEDWSEIESDDDGAGGTDARVEMEVEAGVVYTIRVSTFSSGETGPYTLGVTGS